MELVSTGVKSVNGALVDGAWVWDVSIVPGCCQSLRWNYASIKLLHV